MTEQAAKAIGDVVGSLGLALTVALAFLAPHPEPIRVLAIVFAGDTLRVSGLALISDVSDVRLLRAHGFTGRERLEARSEVRREAARTYLCAVFFAAAVASVFQPHRVSPDSPFSILVGWSIVSTLVVLRINSSLDRRDREEALREYREEYRRKRRRSTEEGER